VSDKVSIHICGKQDHECDNKGPGVLLLNDAPYEVVDTVENKETYADQIVGGSVTCSKCNQSAFSQAYWM